MKHSQNSTVISYIIVIALIISVVYLLFMRKEPTSQLGLPSTGSGDNESEIVVVENTALVNGVLPVPLGFPQDIPLEGGALVESSTTHYSGQNVRQLFVGYRSALSVAEKYSEYQGYLNQAGYHSTTGIMDASGESTISGTKGDATLSIILTSVEGTTLVQLSYILRSISE